jgi:hypothetical protein
MSTTNTVFTLNNGTTSEVAVLSTGSNKGVLSSDLQGNFTSITGSTIKSNDITEVVIGTGVTVIGNNAFRNSQNLQSVTFAERSKCTTIQSNAFQNNVTSLSLPSSLEQIAGTAFSGCKFTSLTIPASVQTIGNSAFQFCTSLTSVTLPTNVNYTSIGAGTFYKCTKLTNVLFPSNIADIGRDAFNSCGITSLTIPASVQTIGDGAFRGCTAMATLTFAKDSSLTTIGANAFYNCKFTSLTIPASVQTIGLNAFKGCKLTTLTVKSNIVSSNFMKTNFPDSINSLKTLVLGGDVITVGGASDGENNGAFASCVKLESVTIGANITTINPNAFVNCAKLAITFLTKSDGSFNSALQTIGSQGFAYCNGLTKLTLPPSVTTLGNGAFFDCDKLTEVSLHKNVTSLGQSNNAFSASALNTLNLTTGNGLGLSAGPNQTIGGRPGVTVKIVSDFKGSYNTPILNGSTVTHNQGDSIIHTFSDSLGKMPSEHTIFSYGTLPSFANWDFDRKTGKGILTLNPGNTHVGNYTIRIRNIHNPTDLESEIRYLIKIVNINDPPVFMSTPVRTARQESLYSYTVRTNDIDVGDLVTVTATTKPSWLSFDGTTLSGTPSRSVWGEYRVVLLATDVLGATATQSFNIMVRKPVCFNEGTKILCLKNGEEQYVAVEQLREGDEVKTLNHGYKKIIDLRKGNYRLNRLADMGIYKMKKQGNMIADLEMTGLHCILVDPNDSKYADDIKRQGGLKNEKFFVDGKFRLRANQSHEFEQMECKDYTIYSFALEDQQEQYGIWANGVLAETTSKRILEISNMQKIGSLKKDTFSIFSK